MRRVFVEHLSVDTKRCRGEAPKRPSSIVEVAFN